MFSRAAAAAGFQKRATTTPPPIIVQPSGSFDGNDGNWSSLLVGVGSPPQYSKVLPSTLIGETWIVMNGACNAAPNSGSCVRSRGGNPNLFNPNASTSFVNQGGYSFQVESEQGLDGNTDGGLYGYDTVSLQTASDSADAVLNHQVVSAFLLNKVYLGQFGLSQRRSNIPNNTQDSFLTTLYNTNQIPSLSYSYHAGAYYRGQTPASLVLGGYDANRFTPSSLFIPINPDDDTQLTIGLQGVTYFDSTGTQTSVLNSGILSQIDSTFPNIYLPQDACNKISDAFGLQFQNYQGTYTINDTMRSQNYKNGASLNFTLGSNISGGNTVTITLPYAAFDLNYTNPDPSITGNATRYFPLLVASDPSQYIIGRSFLQEAVLTVDYSNKSFSVAQAKQVTTNTQPDIRALLTTSASDNGGSGSNGGSSNNGGGSNSSGGSNTGAIAGGVVGGVVGAILIGVIAFLLWRRKKRADRAKQAGTGSDTSGKAGEMAAMAETPMKDSNFNGAGSPSPPQYPGHNDYFGQAAKEGMSPAITPGAQQPIPAQYAQHHQHIAQQYNPMSELPNTSRQPNAYPMANGFLAPGHAPGHAPATAAAAAAAGGVAGASIAELAGSDARAQAHELHSPQTHSGVFTPTSATRSELASPDHAHEMPTPPSASVSASPGVSPNLAPLNTVSHARPAVQVAEMGAGSPVASNAAAGVFNTGNTTTTTTVSSHGSPAGIHHQTNRSSATIPDSMQPHMQDGSPLPPLPANAATNVTAAELATRPMSSQTDATWLSESAMAPSPNDETREINFSEAGSDTEGVSRNVSIQSATSVRPMRGQVVHHRRGSNEEQGPGLSARMDTVGEDFEGETRENAPPHH